MVTHKRQREYKERESVRKNIRRLRRRLAELPQKQVQRILGLNRKTDKEKEAYSEAYSLADFFTPHIGTAAHFFKENIRLMAQNAMLKETIESLEKSLDEKTGFDSSVKLEPGLIHENFPHRIYISDQYLCPKCGEPGLPVMWKERWVWLHLEDDSENFWEKPKVRLHKIRRGGLGAWWKEYTYQKEHDDCFLYGGKADAILNSKLIIRAGKKPRFTVGDLYEP